MKTRMTGRFLAVAIMWATSCDPVDTNDTAFETGLDLRRVHSVKITPSSVLLTGMGDARTLTAVAYDADGQIVEGDILWSTTDPKLMVNEGVVQASADLGSGQIFAEVNGVRSTPAFALIVDLADDTVLIEDSAVTGFAKTDEDATWTIGVEYTIEVEGLDAPAIGTPVVSAGELPIIGRVVRATGNQWTLQLVPPNEVFDDFEIEETFSGADLTLQINEDLNALYEIQHEDDGTVRFNPNSDRAGFGPFDCEGAVTAGTLTLGPPSFEFTPDFNIIFHWTFADGFKRLLLTGEIETKATVPISLASALSANVSCSLQFGEYPIPVTGPMSAFLGPAVKVGLGLDLSGSMTLAKVGLKAEIKQTSYALFGIECKDESCTWRSELNVPSPEFKLSVDDSVDLATDFRVQTELFAYAFATLSAGVRIPFTGVSYSVDLIDAKMGLNEAWNLAPVLTQAIQPSYASDEKLSLLTSLSSGAIAEINQRLKTDLGLLSVALPTLSLKVPLILSRSPKGAGSGVVFAFADSVVEEGVTNTATLRLDPAHLTWLGADNVDEVVIYQLTDSLTVTERARIKASTYQDVFTWDWKPTTSDAAAPPTFVAFIKPKFWPLFGQVEVEVSDDSRVGFGDCSPTYTAQLALTTASAGLDWLAWDTGSINDAGTISFIADDGNGETVWTVTPSGTPTPVGFQTFDRFYGGGGPINNGSPVQLPVRERVGSNNLARLWDGSGDYTILGKSWEGDFDTPLYFMDVNNRGDVALPALTNGLTSTTLFRWSDGALSEVATYAGTVSVRPQISDSGRIIFRDGDNRLVVSDGGLTVIDTSSPMTRNPGLSMNGDRIAWIAGSPESLRFASPPSYTPVTLLTAGTTYTDLDEESRQGIAHVPDVCKYGASVVVFVGTMDGKQGVHIATVNYDVSGTPRLAKVTPILVEGDKVDGQTVSDFLLFDPISANGNIVVRANTGAGGALIRLIPTWP